MRDINIGHLLKSERYNNYFFSIANDENGKPSVFLYTLIDGVKKIYDTKSIEIKYDNHNIKLDSIMCMDDLFNCRVPFYELCKRADSFNKRILALIGKRGRNEKVYLVQCVKCGYKAHQYMRKFFKCNGCNPRTRKSYDQFVLDSLAKHNSKYDYSDVIYINSRKKVKIFCNKCDKYFYQLPSSHLSGSGCPNCKESKGEIRVTNYLNACGETFTKQHKFEGCLHKSLLRFDFYLSEKNMLIEFDGEGHYKAIFGSTPEEKQKNLEECQLRDKIKDEWVKANGVLLLRIPYWDYDRIEELIEAFILEHSKQLETSKFVLEM
jgi:Zn ribbon nucleic-acid-binding protein/very-short-patch-repair endonuclease